MGLPDLPRKLGWFDAASIVVGIVIGSGIFMVPGSIARSVASAAMILAVWILGGVFSMCGGLAYAELGAMMPSTGGQYVYLREAYGPMWAFLYGWTLFLVYWSGGIAAMATGFALYLGSLVPLTPVASRWTPVVLIAVLTALNYAGVRQAAAAQNLFNALKVIGLLALIGGALASGQTAPPESSAFSWSGVGVAAISCLFAYEGWSGVSFVAGEVRDPERNVPRALALGLAAVIALYVLVNYAYLRVLGAAGMAGADRAGALLAERTLGPAGGKLVSLTIVLAIAGSVSSGLMAGPRVYFAQALDGSFFRWFGRIHPRFQTPSFSIAAQGAWAALLCLTGSFGALISYSMVAAWVFYGMTVAAVIVLRARRPDAPRPYRMAGYPATPVLFCLASLALVINSLIATPGPALAGLGLIAGGIPLYYLWRRIHCRIHYG